MRQLGSSNMRKDHDMVPGWIYTDPKDRKPFTKGTVRMDPDDINKSFDIFFEQVSSLNRWATTKKPDFRQRIL